MLNAAKISDFVEIMYEFNKLILNFKRIRNINKIKFAIYYYTTIFQ